MTSPSRAAGDANGFALSGAARGGTLSLLGAACNQLCLFAIVTVVARERGGRAVGEYTLCWAVLIVVGLLALWGFQPALNRFVAVYLAQGDPSRVRGIIRMALSASAATSLVLAVAVAVLAHPLATLFGNAHLTEELRLVALTLPAATLRDAALAATQGWRTQRPFALIGWVYEPVARLLLTGAATLAGWSVTGIFAVIPVVSWSTAALALISLRRLLRSLPAARPVVDVRTVLRFSTASWGTVLASVGLVWADTLILGVLSTTQQVGIYTIATRIVNLAVFVMVPLNASLAPQFAHLLHLGEPGPLRHAYTTTTRWMLSLSLPAFVLLLVFPGDLLHLFGHEYESAVWVTVILAVGQLLNAATGPCGNLQNMSGHVRLNMTNNLVTLALNVGLNVALIPPFGIKGAAVAWSVSLAVVNIARVVENRLLFGVLPFDRSLIKVLLAAAVAAAVAVAIRVGLAGVLTELVVGVAAGAGAYFAALWLFGFEDDDRVAIRSILGASDSATADTDQPAALP
ncbi:flippase [uncultured Jatrophihabitans sp.]|uniref:flippase n=1 Tax=uncultured Jatrophihabitans sp. TaxID=1610747 RepID=UPI0035CC7F9E